MRRINRRKFVVTAGTALGSCTLSGCSSLNPFASSKGSDEPESAPGPFRKVSVDRYDLVVAFDPHITPTDALTATGTTATHTTTSQPTTTEPTANGTEMEETDGETAEGTTNKESADVSNVNQVLLRDSAGTEIVSGALGSKQVIAFPLLTFEQNDISIKAVVDLGRYSIVAVGPGGNYDYDITLSPDLSVTNVAFPNELENVTTPDSPLAFANPIIEFKNTGTAPAILIESSLTGQQVPNEREEADNRDEDEQQTPGARLSHFADAKHASRSVLALSRTPIPVANSTRIQTGFSPFAVPQKRYAPGGEEGGGIDNLRSIYANETVSADLRIQTRQGTAYQISMEVDLSGGISKLNSPDTTPYYVFRTPTVNSWEANIDK